MTLQQTHISSQPSRSLIAIGTLLVVGLSAAAYSYGRSALENAERANALLVVSENHEFCEALGLVGPSESYRNCMSRLKAMQLVHQHRWQAEAVGLL
jgi:hypothetical protein